MLQRIGMPPAPGDAVDLLLECHGRIRAFLGLARRLGTTGEAAPAEVREAATQVRRYFTLALPLHAADEEESILPRLRGRDPAVDEELATMVREHQDHGRPLAALVAACEGLASDTAGGAARGAVAAAAAEELERHFAAHLAREEAVVFPAVRRLLDRTADAAIVAEIRERRRVAGVLPDRRGT